MFHKPDDIGSSLVPLPLSDLGEPTVTPSDGNITRALFEDLKTMLAGDSEDARILETYLTDCGIKHLLEGDFETFRKAHFATEETNISSLADIYEAALTLFAQQDYTLAVGFFSLVAPLKNKSAISLLALAACATHQALFTNGYDLAVASIKADDQHPRSHLLAGYCAMKLKNMRNARNSLALACRLARKDTAYRAEQRAAQRQLLLIQFS